MSGTTDTQSLRYGTVDDVITHLMVANLADDIATQLNAADIARTAALKRPQVKIERNAAMTIAVTTVTTISFDTETIDTHNMVDLAGQPQRVTCNAAAGLGIYHVRANANVDTTGWTRGDIFINKNGSTLDARTFWGPVSFAGMELETFVNFASLTDYVSLSLYHEGGGSTGINFIQLYVQKVCDA